MADNFEEQNPEGLDFQYLASVARRRYLHFLLPFFGVWLAIWAASWLLPPRYRSTTTILVEEPSMPKDYVTPNINEDLQDRMQSISQQILSRTRLISIIDRFNLYGQGANTVPSDEKIERMRKDIGIELVRDGRNQISAFNVSYVARDPHVAQQVTRELTNLFINENLELRQQQSEDTTQFLETQLEDARKTLADQEEKIRQFKGQHVGEMPTQVASNLQILTGLQAQLQNEQDALNAARQQRVYLQTLRDQYRSMQASGKSTAEAPGGLPAIEQELERLKAQLADLSSRYTDQHPDVRKVKQQIAKTEKLRDQLLAGGTSTNTDAASASQGSNSAQASLMAPIESQLKSNEVEIANRQRSIDSLKGRVEEYQGRLNQEPIREQQLADLTRGYEQSKSTYDDLLKKKNQSKMATSLELRQQDDRFRVVDPASFPQKPEFPNRLKFCAAGIGLGLVLGLVVAGAFEKFDDRMYDPKEIRKMLPVEVIGEIPAITTVADEQIAKRQVTLRWAAITAVSVTILVGAALSYWRG